MEFGCSECEVTNHTWELCCCSLFILESICVCVCVSQTEGVCRAPLTLSSPPSARTALYILRTIAFLNLKKRHTPSSGVAAAWLRTSSTLLCLHCMLDKSPNWELIGFLDVPLQSLHVLMFQISCRNDAEHFFLFYFDEK